MNKINYDRELEILIDSNIKKGIKPKLLLHSCCAPCSSACIERLKDYFELIIFYYNPNLDSGDEYEKRAKEQMRLCDYYGIKYIISDYDSRVFYETVKGFENEKEGGIRCHACFRLRLIESAKIGLKNCCDYFATTLTLSPLKNADKINEIGLEIEKQLGIKYLPTDFKKRGGYQRSIEISKELNLYRQNYCGCVFSKKTK